MTMLADSAEQIRILRFLLSFTLRKNQMGSALRSASATQSAVTAKVGERQQSANERRVLTGGLGYKDHPRHETMICDATLKSLSERHDPHDPEKDTNADGDMS